MLSAQCAIWFAAGHFLPRSLTVGEAWLVSQGRLVFWLKKKSQRCYPHLCASFPRYVPQNGYS